MWKFRVVSENPDECSTHKNTFTELERLGVGKVGIFLLSVLWIESPQNTLNSVYGYCPRTLLLRLDKLRHLSGSDNVWTRGLRSGQWVAEDLA